MLQKITEYLRDNAGLLVTRAITGLVIFTLVYAIAFMVARLVERALKAKSRRGATLATIVRSVISLSGLVAGLVMGLSQLGINVATVLAGAGVIGLAIGFGAQTLVKDCISGFFLILDDVLEVGDRVEINGATGVIERVGLRVTQLRADNGQLWYLPNGTVEKVGNFNREWNRAEVNVGLAYEASVDEALGVLEEVGKKWAAENPELSLAEPIAQGVLELADSSVNIRLVARTKPMKMASVGWELRKRIKEAFDEAGLEIAYPRQVSIDGGKLVAPLEESGGAQSAEGEKPADDAKPADDTKKDPAQAKPAERG